MRKILVVEDDKEIHNLVKELLEKEKYSVINAYSGTQAIDLIFNEKIDLILLDLMLQGLNGEEIVRKVNGTIPIIVISAKISHEGKVSVLLNGANDYITKPFDKQELLARIQVQLRLANNEDNLYYKDMELIQDIRMLKIKNNGIMLTRTEFTILKQLMLNPDKVITKAKLLDLISINTEECDENSLKVHISNIRRKIRKVSQEEYIEAVWGIGFKMKE